MGAVAEVVVIGAGPGGLAVAGALALRGVRAVVLERGDGVGTSWRGHYDRLHLHTPRLLSGLPGMRIPRRYGRWVARDDVVRYLQAYAAHHALDVRTGVDVERLERVDGIGWRVVPRGGRGLLTPHVVVATGYNHTPVIPNWPGQADFPGEIVHAAAYRNPAPYAARRVLVVGTGNTGCEIAQDIADAGAPVVWLAYRTPPHILRRSTVGWPAQATGILVRRLPVPVVDALAGVGARTQTPDLTAYGLPRPSGGLYSRARAGAIPVQDVGIVAAIRRRAVLPVPTLEGFDGPEAVLADGRRVRPDAVVVATGYRSGLEPLLGRLGVLDANGRPRVSGARNVAHAPGLWFTGFTNPISGMFRELRLDGTRIARVIARG